MKSIRSRVLLGSTMAALGLQSALAVVSYHTNRNLLVYHFDDELRTHAGALAALVVRTGDRPVLQFADDLLPFYRSGPEAEYFEARTTDARVIGRSQSLGDGHLPADWGSPEAPRIFDLTLPDGRAGRAIGVRYGSDANAIDIVVAEPRSPLDDALAHLIQSSALSVLGFGLALACLLWFVLRRGLRPLTELSERVARIDAGQPQPGLGMSRVPIELAPVVACVDDLLVRMRNSLDRERRITANIAHELQTPVAELRTVTEVALRWPGNVDYLQRAAGATDAIARRMEAVTTKILALATAERGADPVRRDPVDVGVLLREIVDSVQPRCTHRSIRVAVLAPPSAPVTTDAVILRVVLSNLMQNAVVYAPQGTVIEITLSTAAGAAFTFRNAAPELSEADVAQLAEPYWRKDAARSPDGTAHAGIGLALADELSRRLGGGLEISLVEGHLAVTLRLSSEPSRRHERRAGRR